MSAISFHAALPVSSGVRGRVSTRVRAASAPSRGVADATPRSGRRGIALGLGAALFAALGAPREAEAVTCDMVTPCMPGTEPGAPPRYVLPGPAYSPAEAAEARFREKIQAERAAEKAAYQAKYEREEKAAAAAAAAKAAAEAAAAEAAAAQ
jgi:hypothetical protein